MNINLHRRRSHRNDPAPRRRLDGTYQADPRFATIVVELPAQMTGGDPAYVLIGRVRTQLLTKGVNPDVVGQFTDAAFQCDRVEDLLDLIARWVTVVSAPPYGSRTRSHM